MQFDVITIFPEMFAALNYGIVGRALKKQLISVNYWNPRAYSKTKYGNIDDRSFGGGPGMVMMLEPLRDAIIAARKVAAKPALTIHLSPQGKLLDQDCIKELIIKKHLILIAGRYEGIDERLLELGEIDAEYSIGNYVLSGGEFAAMVFIDAITRMLPDVLGDERSAKQDSFARGLLDYPHYTRPETIAGESVPGVLLRGNHKAIARWRQKQALGRTWLRRPELLQKCLLTKDEMLLLSEFIVELNTDTDGGKLEAKHESDS